MKIIKPSVEFFGAVPTDYENALKFIEVCGRTCYKSEDKITPTSAEGFVRKLIKAGHLAMVEHSNMVARIANTENWLMKETIIDAGKYLRVRREGEFLYVGGNLAAWYQRNKEMFDLDLFFPFQDVYSDLFDTGDGPAPSQWEICPHNEIPKEMHRYSTKFICDRGVSHELVRHRPCSFAQESTRYVNYGGKDMEFIEPPNFTSWNQPLQRAFEGSCSDAEERYKFMLSFDAKPQQARAVLPNALKTEIVVTADAEEWRHIRKLRTSPAAHPDIRRVMAMMPWESFL